MSPWGKTLTISLITLFLIIVQAAPIHATTSVNYFSLNANNPYVPTGIEITQGDTLTIRQDGNGAIYPPGRTVPWVSAAGDLGCTAGPNFTLPNVPCWSLVARIGNSPPILIGQERNFTTNHTGPLYLGINHIPPMEGSGSWRIQVIRNFDLGETPPEPFLQLPWDHEASGHAFPIAALKINSFFDHEYPLLSSSLAEPIESSTNLTSYEGDFNTDLSYSSHDGYDYGTRAGAALNAPVLAAADGCALRYTSCSACGNAILINHPNHYQTRYYHLQSENLVTQSNETCVEVGQGDTIGKVGFSGNVIPEGEKGSHLHFMLVEDKNRDGNFTDNIPDGLTDPFGWQSYEPDPWANYTFNYNGADRVGNDSHYLWQEPLPNLNQELDSNGGLFQFLNSTIEFPPNAVTQPVQLTLEPQPSTPILDGYVPLGSMININLRDLFGGLVTDLHETVTLTFSFTDKEAEVVEPDTIAVYTSEDGFTWEALPTTVEPEHNRATAQVDHFSLFSLAGQLKDLIPPQTQITISGTQLEPTVYSPPVTISLEATDTEPSSGIYFTAFAINDEGWQSYEQPLKFTEPGDYTIHYYSSDANENHEDIQTHAITLIKKAPPPELQFNLSQDRSNIDITTIPTTGVTLEKNKENRLHYTLVATNAQRNFIAVSTRTHRLPFFQSYSIQKISYNENEHYLPQNLYTIITTPPFLARRRGNKIVQWWYLKDHVSIKLVYSEKTNTTYVIEYTQDATKRETIEGFRYLTLTTNQGEIEYSY